MLWWGCMYLKKKKKAQRLVQQWLSAIDGQSKINHFCLLSIQLTRTKCNVTVFIQTLPNYTNISLNLKLRFCSETSFTKYILPSVFVAKFFSKPSWVNSLWFTIQPALLIWWKSSSVTTQTGVCITDEPSNICRHLPAHVRCRSVRSSGRTPTLASRWTCRQCGCERSGNKQETETLSNPFLLKREDHNSNKLFTAGGS